MAEKHPPTAADEGGKDEKDKKDDPAGTAKPAEKAAQSPETAKGSSSVPKTGSDKQAGAEASKPKTPKTQPSQPRKRNPIARIAFWFVVLVAVVAGGGAASFDYWWPRVEPRIAEWLPSAERPDPLADLRFTALVERVDALETSIANAEADTQTPDAIADLKHERAELNAELTAVLERLQTVETSVAEVRDLAQAVTPGDSEGAAESLARINQRLAELEGSSDTLAALRERIEKLETAENPGPDPVQLSQTIESIETRLGALESETPAVGSADGGALMVALGELRTAVRTGEPFADQLQAVTAAAGAVLPEDAVGVLRDHAGAGVPTLAELRESFSGAAAEIARARVEPGGGGWMSEMVAKVSSLVSVRRVDGTDADTLDGRLARAEQALGASDLAGAVGALEGLDGGPSEAAGPWLERARARLACERALSVLNVRAVSILRDG